MYYVRANKPDSYCGETRLQRSPGRRGLLRRPSTTRPIHKFLAARNSATGVHRRTEKIDLADTMNLKFTIRVQIIFFFLFSQSCLTRGTVKTLLYAAVGAAAARTSGKYTRRVVSVFALVLLLPPPPALQLTRFKCWKCISWSVVCTRYCCGDSLVVRGGGKRDCPLRRIKSRLDGKKKKKPKNVSVIFTQHVQSVCIYYTTMCVIIFTYRSDERTLYLNMCVRSLIYLCRRRGSTHTPYVADAASTRALRFCPPGGQNRFFIFNGIADSNYYCEQLCVSTPGFVHAQ